MSGSTIRWGILGTGNIARQFATGVNASIRGTLAAVGSRAAETADTFAASYRVDKSYADYEAMIDDKSVDAVYISLPNSMHHEWTLKSLAAGKHVLCEKPFASNAAESEAMFDASKRAGKVL